MFVTNIFSNKHLSGSFFTAGINLHLVTEVLRFSLKKSKLVSDILKDISYKKHLNTESDFKRAIAYKFRLHFQI